MRMLRTRNIAIAILLALSVVSIARANDFYTHGSFPSTGSPATSAGMRAELDLITAGFDKLPTITGNANQLVVINGAGTALTIPVVGAWTPSVGGTATYTTQVGVYTRIGNLVYVTGRMVINTIGTGSTAVIAGLPFPVDITPVAYVPAAVYFSALTQNVTSVIGLLGSAGGESSVSLYSLTAAGVSITQNAILGNGSAIYFAATYFTP